MELRGRKGKSEHCTVTTTLPKPL
uniref:Uncharacterized protein n=1 Tax=Anguilla anguilla TaxID=7936 RepID=A0A0E9U287_ANGAN